MWWLLQDTDAVISSPPVRVDFVARCVRPFVLLLETCGVWLLMVVFWPCMAG